MVTSSSKDGERSGVGPGPARRGRWASRRGAFAVLVLGGLIGCLDVLGDVNVDGVGTAIEQNLPPPEECTEATLLDSSCVVSCAPGMVRCNSNLLQRCNIEGDAWTLLNQCA